MQAKEPIEPKELYSLFEKEAIYINPFGAFVQCCHESFGNGHPLGSSLAVEGNNLTGMKAGAKWTGDVIEKKTWEQRKDGSTYEIVAKFRSYPSIESFVANYAENIEFSWPNCARDNFMGYFSGFSKGRLGSWATDQKYFEKLLAMAWDMAPNFFDDPKTKFKNVLVNACDRNLFVEPAHRTIAIFFVKEHCK